MRSLLPLAVVLCAVTARAAEVELPHHGRLFDAADRPVEAPALAMTFALYASSSPVDGESAKWQSGPCEVEVHDGYYAVALGVGGAARIGCGTNLGSELFEAGVLYLQVTVDNVSLTPRLRLGRVPIASTALSLEGRTLADLDARYVRAAGGSAGTVTIGGTVEAGTLRAGTIASTGDVTAAGTFQGDGAGLTNVPAGALSGVVSDEALPADLARTTGAVFTGDVEAAAGATFRGNGSGLTQLSASQLTGGPIALDVLPPTLARTTGATFTGDIVAAAGAKHAGDGSALTNLDAGALATGLVPLARGGTGASDAAGARSALGLGTAATLAADRIPLLDAQNRLPAVDGSRLTGIVSGLTWTTVSANTTVVVGRGYVADGTSRLTLTLPSTCAVGDTVRVIGRGAGGWTLAAPSGVQILDPTGAGTLVNSTRARDAVELVCTAPGEFSIASASSGLYAVPPYTSCKTLYAAGTRGDGTYTLSVGNQTFNAYCDMTNDGGGWTLVAGVGNDTAHRTSGAAGGWPLTTYALTSKGKFSDAVIDALVKGAGTFAYARTAQLGYSSGAAYFRLTSWTSTGQSGGGGVGYRDWASVQANTGGINFGSWSGAWRGLITETWQYNASGGGCPGAWDWAPTGASLACSTTTSLAGQAGFSYSCTDCAPALSNSAGVLWIK